MNQLPNLEWLRAFAIFAQKLNFTHTAKVLHLTQPAVHAQIRKLSAHYDRILYVRQGRTLALTPDGLEVAAFAREALDGAERLAGRLGLSATARPVTLCAGQGALLYLLGERLQTLAAPLRVLVRGAEGAVEAVQQGLAQVAVSPAGPRPELETRMMTTVGHAVLMPQSHRFATRESLSLGDLQGERLILPPADGPMRIGINRLAASLGVELTVSVEARGWPLVARLAEWNQGLAVVNDFVPQPLGCVAVPFEGLPPLSYRMFRRRRPHLPAELALWHAIGSHAVPG